MIKLICDECGAVWFTAIESDGQKCDDCGGELRRVHIDFTEDSKEEKNR